MTEMPSISIRLQRVTTEVAYVSVPVTPDLVLPDGADPSAFRLNVEGLFEAAVKLGKESNGNWAPESVSVVPHPVQDAPPPDSGSFRE